MPQNVKQFITNAEAVNHLEVECGVFLEFKCFVNTSFPCGRLSRLMSAFERTLK